MLLLSDPPDELIFFLLLQNIYLLDPFNADQNFSLQSMGLQPAQVLCVSSAYAAAN